MSEFPALNLYTDAFLGDTIHLSAAECGAYCRLLFLAWRINDGGLPDDEKALARYAGCSKAEWKRLAPAVMSFFFLEKDGKFRQKRLEVERKKARGKSEKARRSGNASAAAKSLKNNDTTSTNVGAELTPSSNETPTKRQLGANYTTSTSTSTSTTYGPTNPSVAACDDKPEPAWAAMGRAVKNAIAEFWPDDARVIGMHAGLTRQWLADGYDLERDVLPTVTRLCADKPDRKPPGSLGYFTDAIARRHRERLAEQASGTADAISDADAIVALRTMLETAYRRDGVWRDAWPWRPEMGIRPDDPRYVWESRA